ncbi:MAG: NUDIX hydrolase [Deltaproteobacteria bacterium]|nr:MAG: NUDIX hydrolase [Deltaproteobacteria bacterium]
MERLSWKRLKRKRVYEGKIFDVYQEHSRRMADGREHDFDILECPDWVNVTAVTPAGNLVLVRQWRHGNGKVTLEIPGGAVDPGESPLQAARRELEEETGYRANKWHEIGVVEPNPAFQTNRTWTFLALAATPTGSQNFDPTEQVEVVEWPLGNVWELVESGEIEHALVICALFHLLRHGQLGLPGRL